MSFSISFAQIGLNIVRDSAIVSAFNSAAVLGTRVMKWNPQNYLPAILNPVIYNTVYWTSVKVQLILTPCQAPDPDSTGRIEMIDSLVWNMMKVASRIRLISALLASLAAFNLTTLIIPALFKTRVSFGASLCYTFSSMLYNIIGRDIISLARGKNSYL